MRTRLHRPRATGLRHCLAAAAALLGLPAAAAAAHLDGFVFEFTQPAPQAAYHAFCRHALPCHPTSPVLRTIATTSWAGNYLGAFGEETLSFQALDYVDFQALRRDRAYLSFDLVLTGAWFGPEDPSDPGFETAFKVVANGKTLFDATVDNNLFPPIRHFDLIFDFTPNTPNCCADVSIELSARFGPGFDDWEFPEFDPRWGIDNFVVSSTPIPEPSAGALVGAGLLLLAAGRRLPNSRL